MGFTKKTWLALALAIVLVLGLSAVALAADSVTLTDASIKTGTTAGATKVTVSFDAAPATGKSVSLAANTTGVVSITPATIATDGTKTSFEFTATAVKPGTTTFTAKLGTDTVTTSSVLSVKPDAIKFSIDKLAVLSGDTRGTSVSFTIQDSAGNILPRTMVNVTATTGSGLLYGLDYASSTDIWTVTGSKPGAVVLTAKAVSSSLADGLVDATLTGAVNPDVIKFTTDATEPYEIYTAETSVGAGDNKIAFILKDTAGNPIEGALVKATPTTSGITDQTSATTTGKVTITAGTVAGKVTLTATVGTGDAAVSYNGPSVTVYDATKVKSFAVTMDNGTAFAADKDKEAKAVDYIDGNNTHVFEVPTSNIVPETATTKADLEAGKPKDIKWTTSTPKVVKITVGATDATTGVVKPGELAANKANVQFLKAGTAKLTVKVGDVSRTFTFNVKTKKATAIVTIPDMNLIKDQYKQVKPVAYVGTVGAADYNPNVRTNFTYSSSKKTVATVTSKGVVKGVKAGTATITAKDKISGKKTTFKVTVGTDISKINYRAYALVSKQKTLEDYSVLDALANVNYDGKTTIKYAGAAYTDEVPNWAWLETALDKLKTGGEHAATEDDIFAFYFSGKINSTGEIELAKDADGKIATVKVDTLLGKLAEIPGTVFLIMDCDMSSLALTSKGVAALTPAQFNNMVINSAKKSSLKAKTIGTASADVGSYKQKFKVLVSTSTKKQTANYDTYQYTEATTPYTVTSRWFTQHLSNGLGTYFSGRMPADANKNRVITLKELYNYVSKNVKADVATYNKGKAKADKVSQVVSVYPAKGDAFPVYARVAPYLPDLG